MYLVKQLQKLWINNGISATLSIVMGVFLVGCSDLSAKNSDISSPSTFTTVPQNANLMNMNPTETQKSPEERSVWVTMANMRCH